MPNIDELSALFINKNAIDFSYEGTINFWSSTVVDSEHAMSISPNTASKYVAEKEAPVQFAV